MLNENMASRRPTLKVAYSSMQESDRELAHIAEQLLDRHYVHGRHEVVTAMRLENGSTATGIHMEASQGRSSICAEGVALGQSIEKNSHIMSIISVLRRPDGELYLIEPCGVCAELLFDYCPDATIWVGDKAAMPKQVTVRDLLPFRKSRAGR